MIKDPAAQGYQWTFDEPRSILEAKALIGLQGTGVIDFYAGVKTGDELIETIVTASEQANDLYKYGDFFPDNETVLQDYRKKVMEGVRIHAFDREKFNELCISYQLDPNINRLKARLKINDHTIYIQTTYGTYSVERAHKGQAHDILDYCYQRPDETIEKTELNHACHLTSGKTLRQIMGTGKLFNVKDGMLKPFIKVHTDSVCVRKVASITKEELKRIQNTCLIEQE